MLHNDHPKTKAKAPVSLRSLFILLLIIFDLFLVTFDYLWLLLVLTSTKGMDGTSRKDTPTRASRATSCTSCFERRIHDFLREISPSLCLGTGYATSQQDSCSEEIYLIHISVFWFYNVSYLIMLVVFENSFSPFGTYDLLMFISWWCKVKINFESRILLSVF